jgi:CheY-like chemotaxis protein
MRRVAVLVIEQGEEAGLIRAALARSPGVRVIEATRVADALDQLDQETAPVALAIAGGAALAGSADEVVKRLGGRGIPVVGLVTGFGPAERQRALAAGIREIHDRPTEWRPYSELIDSLVARFTPAGLPPNQSQSG